MVKIGIQKIIKNSRCLVVFAAAMLLLVACNDASADPPGVVDGPVVSPPVKTIVWGKVDSEPTDAILKWQPMVDYLAANLGGPGEWSGEVKIAEDMVTMGRWATAGEVDLIRDSLYPAMIVAEASGAVPLALRNTGKPDKQAVFFTRSDSGITSLQDLKGEVISLEERHSTSGFMLPVAHLKKAGIDAREVSEDNGPQLAASEVGYQFAGDDDVVALWVLNGTTIAGAVDSKTFSEFEEANPGVLVNLGETETISSASVLLVRKDMDPALQDQIKQVLLNMDATEQGRAVLEQIDTENFSDVGSGFGGVWGQTMVMYQLIAD